MGPGENNPQIHSVAQRTKLFMDSSEEPPVTRSRRKGEFKKRTSTQDDQNWPSLTGRYKARGEKSFNNQTNPGAGTFTV